MDKISIPETLLENLQHSLCIAWCGAGLSVPSGLPTWRGLIKEMIAACERGGLGEDAKAELKNLLQWGDFDDIVDFCRDFLGEGEYRDVLRRLFAGTPCEAHRKLASLPFSAICTTNYDKLIENAIATLRGAIPLTYTNRDAPALSRPFARNEFFVLKVHGDIERPDTVVLSSRDYTEHLFGNIAFVQFLQRLFFSKSVLFVGTSFSDVYIRRLLEETRYRAGGLGLQHFAILPRDEAGPIRSRLLRERYNISAIPFDPSADSAVEKIFQAIADRLTA